MKLFHSEYRHDYTSYTFGYTMYAVFESASDINDLYEFGYLPYTGNLQLQHDLYYKSRGIRVNLKDFKDTSENRRVDRKAESLNIQFEIIPIHEFKEWDAFYKLSNEYSAARIGESKMPAERLEYISTRKYLSHIIRFYNEKATIGYVLAVISEKIFHYWFSFYDVTWLDQNIPIGKWLMWKGIKIAKEIGCDHAYLGNGYLESSQYKTRDFTNIEFYDGNGWSKDIAELNKRCKEDNIIKDLDLFKLMENKDAWLDKL